ncbi:hypothetical protein C8J56DRAFT_1173964 [Mycena floridula]|nr:hypothetical protein C8J56DRAFT_1173964 [Mycena floridula]
MWSCNSIGYGNSTIVVLTIHTELRWYRSYAGAETVNLVPIIQVIANHPDASRPAVNILDTHNYTASLFMCSACPNRVMMFIHLGPNIAGFCPACLNTSECPSPLTTLQLSQFEGAVPEKEPVPLSYTIELYPLEELLGPIPEKDPNPSAHGIRVDLSPDSRDL